MFKRLDVRKVLGSNDPSATPATSATPTREPDSRVAEVAGVAAPSTQNASRAEPDDLEDSAELRDMLVENMEAGGAYRRIFPQVESYLSRVMMSDDFELIRETYEQLKDEPAKQVRLNSQDPKNKILSELNRQGPPYPDGLGRVKCFYCALMIDGNWCQSHKQRVFGTALLRMCSDYQRCDKPKSPDSIREAVAKEISELPVPRELPDWLRNFEPERGR